MGQRPTCQELRERVKKLEKEALLAMQAKEALQESEERYRCLVETMNDGLLVRNENDVIVYVNEKLCQMSGYSREEIIGCPLSRFLDENNRVLLEEESARRRLGGAEPYEITWTRQDGRNMAMIISPKPLFDGEGRYQGSFVVITDITSRKEAEETLQRSWMELDELVRKRTEELARANEELAKHRSQLENFSSRMLTGRPTTSSA